MSNVERHTAFVALGSNLGDSLQTLRAAVQAMAGLGQTSVSVCSSAYWSAPVGTIQQPDFINGVCQLHTGLAPLVLLRQLLELEADFGRQRRGEKGGPRTLDLDLLLYGSQSFNTAELSLPHPRLHERAFVLYPLVEIAPELEIPGLGRVQALAAACAAHGIKRLPQALCSTAAKGNNDVITTG